MRSGLTVPLNLTSRGIQQHQECRATRGVRLSDRPVTHKGKKKMEGEDTGRFVRRAEAMQKEIFVFYIRDKARGGGGRTDGHWLAWLVCEIWLQGFTCSHCQYPWCHECPWMAPFKCMRGPLPARTKKIKGGCSIFYYFLEIRCMQHKLSSPGRKGGRVNCCFH